MQFGVQVEDHDHAAARYLAKLQQMQDQYSRYFSVSIRVVTKDAEGALTVESNGSSLCMVKRDDPSSFCQAFMSRVLDASEPFQVYTCPYGQLMAVGRLAVSTHIVSPPYSNSVYYLAIVDRTSSQDGGSSDADSLRSLMNDTDAQKRIDFIDRAKIIYSAYSLAFSFAGNHSDSDNSSHLDREQRAKILKRLTKRELDVLRLVCTGQSNQQIAEQLVISEHTVKLHIGNILKKTGLTNRTQLAIMGLELF